MSKDHGKPGTDVEIQTKELPRRRVITTNGPEPKLAKKMITSHDLDSAGKLKKEGEK
jgi:hypothetical protein